MSSGVARAVYRDICRKIERQTSPIDALINLLRARRFQAALVYRLARWCFLHHLRAVSEMLLCQSAALRLGHRLPGRHRPQAGIASPDLCRDPPWFWGGTRCDNLAWRHARQPAVGRVLAARRVLGRGGRCAVWRRREDPGSGDNQYRHQRGRQARRDVLDRMAASRSECRSAQPKSRIRIRAILMPAGVNRGR